MQPSPGSNLAGARSHTTKGDAIIGITATPKPWSRTESLRRITVAAKAARKVAHLPRNAKLEIGSRVIPTNSLVAPTATSEASDLGYPEGDDLVDMWLGGKDYLSLAEHFDGIEGAVLHFYFYCNYEPPGWGCEWQLEDVVVVWLGFGDEDARVIDTRFVRYPDNPTARLG